MHLYNTATKKVEHFVPQNPPQVSLYSCGPTVYDFTHLGHIRYFTGVDLLKRALTYLGFSVNHVMNITDVGHLTGDNDSGEDKMEKGARKSGKSVWDVAKSYTDFFHTTMKESGILPPNHELKATDYIPQMISLIQILIDSKHTYETKEALYFDVSTFPSYGSLSGQKLSEKKQAVREEVYVDSEKKQPADFALWFKKVGRFENHEMHWSSPWGEGFPGWHIECSAISSAVLGKTIDIHTGGVDHIPVHHENEIAQSESAGSNPFVRTWMHFEFLTVDGKKMSKSLNNFFTIEDIKNKGIDPLSLRLLFMQTHYRQQMNFTWESASSAHEAYKKLVLAYQSFEGSSRSELSPEKLKKIDIYRGRFSEAIANDLNFPQAVAVVWEVVKSNIPSLDKQELLNEFNQVLGFDFSKKTQVEEETKLPQNIKDLHNKRETARKNKDYTLADSLRTEVESQGYRIIDTSGFSSVVKK